MTKAKKVKKNRTKMSESEIDAFAKRYAKAHDLKGSELTSRFMRVAVTRLAALERDQKKNAKNAKRASKLKQKKAA